MIRIGANPICWSNDDMQEIGAHIPLEQCLTEAHEIGYQGMELGNKFPRTADKLGPILEHHGHQLVSGWYSTELLIRDVDAEMAAVAAHATLLKELGAGVLIIAETSNAIHGKMDVPLSARPVLGKDEWGEFGVRLTDFANRIQRAYSLLTVYHHHMGTVVQSEADIDRLMQCTGETFHLLLDTGHAVWGGGDPARIARHYRPRIAHFHTKDVREAVMWRSRREDWSFLESVLKGVYTVPGDGQIDYAPILDAMHGYDGWIVVEAEQDTNTVDARAYAKLGYDNLSRMLRHHGYL